MTRLQHSPSLCIPIQPYILPPSHTTHTITTNYNCRSPLQVWSVGKTTQPNFIPNGFLRRLLNVYNASWLLDMFTSMGIMPSQSQFLTFRFTPTGHQSSFQLKQIQEHIVHDRLTQWLEHKHLPPNIFGFRPHCGTLDALLQLHHHIQEGFNHKQYTLVAFLGLKGVMGNTVADSGSGGTLPPLSYTPPY